jgi:thioredoxin-dependent peroxiredoxin
MKTMEIGQKLPEVLGIDQDGKEWTLAELSGKKIVLYIYPRDSTPGCTNEACNLRDNYERFLSLGYVVIGVSTQDAKSHKKFIEKNNLPFPLICDTEKVLVNELGVFGAYCFFDNKPKALSGYCIEHTTQLSLF